MKIIKCECGCETMRVEKRESCTRCPHNGCVHCDEEYCKIAEAFCRGIDFDCPDYLPSAEGGDCDLENCNNNGCLLTRCSTCGEIVHNSPFFEY